MSEIADTLRQIADDCATDVQDYEGAQITGKQLGVMFGNTLAMLAAVAKIAAIMSDRIDGLERTLNSRTEHLV